MLLLLHLGKLVGLEEGGVRVEAGQHPVDRGVDDLVRPDGLRATSRTGSSGCRRTRRARGPHVLRARRKAPAKTPPRSVAPTTSARGHEPTRFLGTQDVDPPERWHSGTQVAESLARVLRRQRKIAPARGQNMFGSIGMPELILIFIVALLVFGPKKLPELGKSLGEGWRSSREASEDLKSTIEDEIEQGKHEAEAVKKQVAEVGQRSMSSATPYGPAERAPSPPEARPAEGASPGPTRRFVPLERLQPARILDSRAASARSGHRPPAGQRRRAARGWGSSSTWTSSASGSSYSIVAVFVGFLLCLVLGAAAVRLPGPADSARCCLPGRTWPTRRSPSPS